MRTLLDALEEIGLWATSELAWRRVHPCAWADILRARVKLYRERGWKRAERRAMRRLVRAESKCKAKRLEDQRATVKSLGR